MRDLNYCHAFRKTLISRQNEYYKLFDNETIEEKLEDETKPLLIEDPLEDFVMVKIESLEENLDESEESEATLNEECPQCLQFFESVELAKHIKESHSAPKASTLEIPSQKVHSRDPKTKKRKPKELMEVKKRKQCGECGILVKNLSEHQKIIHQELKRFCCDFCNYSCYFKTKITRHLQRHIPKHLREQFPCDDCTFVATRKDALKSHRLTMHQEMREKNFICKFNNCGRKFYNRSQLKIHAKSVHEKIRNHLCMICGKAFFNSKDLEMHVKRHGEKNCACEICGNRFYCNLDLKRHLKIHSEPSILCGVFGCDKKFYTNSKLKMHVKIRHEGEKNFFCDYCR